MQDGYNLLFFNVYLSIEKEDDIMATKSFTSDTFVLNSQNASKFRNIMDNEKKVRITKVNGHKTVKSKKAIKDLLNL